MNNDFRNILVILFVNLVITGYALAETNSPQNAKVKKSRWTRLSEIERDKRSRDEKYKSDKSLLERKYQDGLNQIQNMEGDRKKAIKNLNREYARQKEKLLDQYRYDKRTFAKEEAALKGRRYGNIEDVRKKLEDDPIYNKRSVSSPSRKTKSSYIKKAPRSTKSNSRYKYRQQNSLRQNMNMRKGSYGN